MSAVADGGDRLVAFGEMADDFEDPWVEAEVLGGAAAGDDEAGILQRDVGEGGVEGEVVAGLFGVGLVAFEVVDGGADVLAGLLSGQTAWTM